MRNDNPTHKFNYLDKTLEINADEKSFYNKL